MISPSRSFILIIGQSGAYLLAPPAIEANTLFADATDPQAVAQLLQVIARAPRLPVILLIDTAAVYVRNEHLPRLSASDSRALLAKRLDKAFVGCEIKHAITTDRSRALMMAAGQEGALDIWLARLKPLPNPSGFMALLPVESTGLLTQLNPSTKSGWALLLSYHAHGGFRQMVTHHGQLIYTRLTMPCQMSSSTGFIAAALGVEIKATRDYLARFGLTPDQPLALTAIVPPFIEEAMNVTPLDVATRRIYSPHNAAATLGLERLPSVDETKGELVHALWFSAQRDVRALIASRDLRQQQRDRRISLFGWSAVAGALVTAILLLATQVQSTLKLHQTINATTQSLSDTREQMNKAQTELEQAAKPLDRLRKAAERQRLFAAETPTVLQNASALNELLGSQARLTELQWDEQHMNLTARLTSPLNAPQRFDEILTALRRAFPDYTLTMATDVPADRSDTVLTNKKTTEPDSLPSARYQGQRRMP